MKKFAWSKAVVWSTFLFLCAATVALAADGAAAAPAMWDSWKGLTKGIGAGILAGLSVAALGFAKDKDPNKKWDPKQAGVTLLVGAVMGGVAGFEKKDLTHASDWYQAGTAVLLAELVGKASWRNIGPVITGFIQGLLGKKSES